MTALHHHMHITVVEWATGMLMYVAKSPTSINNHEELQHILSYALSNDKKINVQKLHYTPNVLYIYTILRSILASTHVIVFTLWYDAFTYLQYKTS